MYLQHASAPAASVCLKRARRPGRVGLTQCPLPPYFENRDLRFSPEALAVVVVKLTEGTLPLEDRFDRVVAHCPSFAPSEILMMRIRSESGLPWAAAGGGSIQKKPGFARQQRSR